jgi:hypothetical protein
VVIAIDLESAFLGFAAGVALASFLAWFVAGKLSLVRQMEKDARALARHWETEYTVLRSRLAARVIVEPKSRGVEESKS